MGSFRKQRVGELLQGCIARNLSQLQDPRFQFLTISEVNVSPDLKYARVYWTMLSASAESFPTKSEIDSMSKELEQEIHFFQQKIASELKLRYTPRLSFLYDSSLAQGARIDHLLQEISKKAE